LHSPRSEAQKKPTTLFRNPATRLDLPRNIARMPVLATGGGFIINKRSAAVSFWPAASPNAVEVAPGDQHRHADVAWFELGMERFASQQDVSLARSVSGVARHRLISEQTSDQQDAAGSALHHIRCKGMCEFRHREHVQPQHAEDFLKRLIGEVSIEAATGIVDQNVYGDAALIEARLQLNTGASDRKIDSFDDYIHMILLMELLSQSLHRLRATRSQYQVRLLLGQGGPQTRSRIRSMRRLRAPICRSGCP
jgi:hypothetical protein